jgi:hypothetical protein
MKFERQTFTTDVTLDYNDFTDCEIKDCVIFFCGGDFSLVRTTLNNVRFALGGPANCTLNFLRLVRLTDPNAINELLNHGPQPNQTDMKVTIN